MNSYTITITPDDDSGNSTTLTVDTSTGQARITSVHMHAPAGLTGAQMPSIDVELLLQAVTSPTHTPAAIAAKSTTQAEAAPQPATVNAGEGVDEPRTPDTTATPQSATGDRTPSPTTPTAPPARRASRRSAAATRTTDSAKAPASGDRRRRTQPAAKAPAPKKTTRKQANATAADADSGSARVYRRMPDDFTAVYRQAGTAAAIADHYGVPRYTAQGWIGRYNKQHAAANN
jgi:hypothetical protein